MRLFVGIEMEEEMKHALAAAAEAAEGLFPGKYALRDNYHMTLQFIGQAEAGQIPAIERAAKAAAAGKAPFEIRLAGLAFFRRPQDAVLFCGVEKSPVLEGLALCLERELARAGFSLDSAAFHPHITLARQAKIDPSRLAEISPLPAMQTVERITLFESRREGRMLRYVPLARYPLEK